MHGPLLTVFTPWGWPLQRYESIQGSRVVVPQGETSVRDCKTECSELDAPPPLSLSLHTQAVS